jgi:hypothetical protein
LVRDDGNYGVITMGTRTQRETERERETDINRVRER